MEVQRSQWQVTCERRRHQLVSPLARNIPTQVGSILPEVLGDQTQYHSHRGRGPGPQTLLLYRNTPEGRRIEDGMAGQLPRPSSHRESVAVDEESNNEPRSANQTERASLTVEEEVEVNQQ